MDAPEETETLGALTLAEVLARAPEGRIPLPLALHVALEVAGSMESGSHEGSTILLSRAGEVKLGGTRGDLESLRAQLDVLLGPDAPRFAEATTPDTLVAALQAARPGRRTDLAEWMASLPEEPSVVATRPGTTAIAPRAAAADKDTDADALLANVPVTLRRETRAVLLPGAAEHEVIETEPGVSMPHPLSGRPEYEFARLPSRMSWLMGAWSLVRRADPSITQEDPGLDAPKPRRAPDAPELLRTSLTEPGLTMPEVTRPAARPTQIAVPVPRANATLAAWAVAAAALAVAGVALLLLAGGPSAPAPAAALPIGAEPRPSASPRDAAPTGEPAHAPGPSPHRAAPTVHGADPSSATSRAAPARAGSTAPVRAPAAPSVEVLRARLAGVSARIADLHGRVPAETLDALERRYFDLRTAVAPDLDDAARTDLGARIDQLAADIP